MDPEIQSFAIAFTKRVIPDIESIVETYKRDPKEGMVIYLHFLKKAQPSVKRIVKGLRHPHTAGQISPRLLRDPLSINLTGDQRSTEEKEAHVVGYLKAILQLVYCVSKGLEGWQFSSTALYEETQKTQSVGKVTILSSLLQIVRKEVIEIPIQIISQESTKNKKIITKSTKKIQTDPPQNSQESDFPVFSGTTDKNGAVPFTAKLMAYYRAQESKRNRPLIVDPFAERLAGDTSSYANTHRYVCGSGDYSIVRSYYIENSLLTPWCNTHLTSQIVLLGAGLDTRAYRFKPLQKNTHTLFEIDFSNVICYKKERLHQEQPLCDLVRLSADLTDPDWTSNLTKYGFSSNIPTFWVLEGLLYYIDQDVVSSLLAKAAKISAANSQIFADICVPALAELVFGPFTRYFKWGLNKQAVPIFFANAGWNISCSFADEHDQGRDVGQRGLIFVHGTKNLV